MTSSLTDHERAILDAIAARLIPTDASGPGAREAGVVRYVEQALATDYQDRRAAYSAGLAALDAHAVSTHGGGFVSLTSGQQDEMLTELERQSDPFFELVRTHAIEGMFGDPVWGGNAGLVGWEVLGYAGPRLEWTREEQQLGYV